MRATFHLSIVALCFVGHFTSSVAAVTCTVTENSPEDVRGRLFFGNWWVWGCLEPDPDLNRCYYFNQDACCSSIHDELIENHIKSILPKACDRKFTGFEQYLCTACDPKEPTYIDTETKELRICQSTSDKLFEDDVTQYDSCGTLVGNGEVLLPGSTKNSSTSKAIISTASEFFNYQASDGSYPFRPPFFQDYTVVIVPDGTLPCVAAGSLPGVTALTIFLAIFLTIVVSIN